MRWYMRACRAEVEDTKEMEVFIYVLTLLRLSIFSVSTSFEGQLKEYIPFPSFFHFLPSLGVLLLLALWLLVAESFFLPLCFSFFGFLISSLSFFFFWLMNLR